MATSFERKIATIFLFLFFAMTCIGYYTYNKSRSYKATNFWVEHTEDVLYASDQSISLIKEFDINNGSASFDGINVTKWKEATSDSLLLGLNALKTLTQDNATQQVKLSQLLILAQQRIGLVDTFLQLKNKNVGTKENLDFYIVKSNRCRVKIIALFNAFQDEERHLLFLRKERNEKSITQFYFTVYILLISIFLLFTLMGWAVKNYLAERRKNIKDLSKAKLFLESINSLTRIGNWEIYLEKKNCDLSSLASMIYEVPFFQTPTLERMLGFYKEGENRNTLLKAIKEAQLRKSSFDLQLQIVTFTGRERWVEIKGVSEFSNGICKRIYGTLQNIDDRKKAENKITENEALLQNIYDNVPVLIGVAKVIDNKIFHVKVNKALAEYIGLNEEQIVGHYSSDIGTPPSIVEYWINKFKEADKTRKPLHIEYERTYPDKTPNYLSGVITCLKEAESGEKSFAYILNDITKYRVIEAQLNRSVAQFKGTFEYSGIGMAIVSLDGKWMEVNRRLCEIMGYSKEELLGKSFREITFLDDIETDWGYAKELIDGKRESYQMEKRYIHKNGSLVWVLLTVSILRDNNGNLIHFIAQIENITPRKEADAEIEQKNIDLAIANQELEQFAYVASHDLQEPLRVITGFINLFETRYNHLFDDGAKKYMFFIKDGAIRMRNIISDILEYSKLSKLDIEVYPVDLNKIFNEIAQIYLLNKKTIKPIIEWDEMPEIVANKAAIQQLFTNLISNAIKYQKPDNQPKIKIEVQDKDKHWQFSVTDNGIGIDPKSYKKVFAVFKRLHNNEEYSGTGIGLAICLRVVQKHHGEIWIEPAKDGGSIFYFTIAKNIKNKINKQDFD